MRAVSYDRYGPPDVLHVGDVPAPTADADRLLVRVRAAAINPYDWRIMRADPALVRTAFGLRRPRRRMIAGSDAAGVVVAVGPEVERFRVGDEVYGFADGGGGCAELLAAPEGLFAHKPANLTFEQAAAVPVAGLTAWHALERGTLVRPGDRVLVNGASGGVGSFVVQLAKAAGAVVTGVCSGRNGDRVRGLGADRVLDYGREDFTSEGSRYDVVVDTVGNHSLRALRRLLPPAGALVLVGGGGGRLLGPAAQTLRGGVMGPFVPQRVLPVSWKPAAADLEALTALLESGAVVPLIDRTYRLEETADAMRYLETKHARGKVVISVAGA